jgi:hypothetical protein
MLTGENLLQLEPLFDEFVAPMICRLLETGVFELEKMPDEVLAE